MRKLQLLSEILATVYATSDQKLGMLILSHHLPEDFDDTCAVHITPSSFMEMAKLMSNYFPGKECDLAFKDLLLELYEEGMISFSDELLEKLKTESVKLDDYVYIQ